MGVFPVMSPSCFLGSKLLGKGVPLPFNFLSPSNPPRPSPAQPAQPAGSVHSGTPILMELAPPASRPHRRVWCLETQHPRQGDLGPQCAHPGWEHLPPPPPPPILHKSSGGAVHLRSRQGQDPPCQGPSTLPSSSVLASPCAGLRWLLTRWVLL